MAFSKISKKNTAAAIVVLSCWVIGYKIYKYTSKKKLQSQLKEFERKSIKENQVILHTSKPWNFPCPHGSPAVVKLISFLEFSNIPYTIDTTMPKHFYTTKSPWITYKTYHIADSNIIIEWISNQSSFDKINIDKHLNKKQLAILNAFKSMIEDGLYFVIVWRRMCLDDNISKYMELMLGGQLSLKHKLFINLYFKKHEANMVWAQGISRLNPNEIYKKGNKFIQNVVDYMGDKKFFFGDKLTTLDLTIFGHIGTMYQLSSVLTWGQNKELPAKLPCKKEINEYMKRIEIECFGKVKYWKDIV